MCPISLGGHETSANQSQLHPPFIIRVAPSPLHNKSLQSLHSQPLYASSPKYYCSSPLHPLLDLPTGRVLRLAMLAGSFGSGVCCPQAVLLGTARVRGGRGGPAITDWEDQFGEDTRYSRWSIKTQG